MKDYLFIVNTIAGGGKAKSAIPIIDEIMSKRNYSYEIIKTNYRKEASKIVEDNIDEYKIFVAVGGDGTINEVCQGLINKKKGKLGIIPTGTGNDLAKDLGLSLNPEESLMAILNGSSQKLDVGRVNEYNFINIASIGYDAEVIKNHNKFKGKIQGGLVYFFSVLYTLIGFKSKEMELTIDGKKYSGKYLLLAVGNGKYYGGGFKILPDANINDGKLHICTISHLNRLKILLLFPTVLFGWHIKIKKYVDICQVEKLRVKLEEATCLNIDGEIIKGMKDLEFSLGKYEINLIS